MQSKGEGETRELFITEAMFDFKTFLDPREPDPWV